MIQLPYIQIDAAYPLNTLSRELDGLLEVV